MAWSRVQGATVGSSGATSGTTIVVTLGAAVGSGGAVIGVVSWDAVVFASVTVTDDQGNNYNVETAVLDPTNLQYTASFSRTNITNGPTVITATFSSSVPYRIMFAEEFSGGSTAGPDERDVSGGQHQASPGTSTDAITSGSFTTTVNGDLVWGSTWTFGNHAASVGTGFTASTTHNTADNTIQSEYLTQGSAGSIAATFTQAVNQPRSTTLVALKPAGGAAPARTPYNPWPQAGPVLAQ